MLNPDCKTRLINKGTRNGRVLLSFIDYCLAHPDQRFWQALLNWSKVPFILVSTHHAYDVTEGTVTDPYNWEGRNEL